MSVKYEVLVTVDATLPDTISGQQKDMLFMQMAESMKAFAAAHNFHMDKVSFSDKKIG